MNETLTLQELVEMNGQQVWTGEPFNDWVKLIIGPYGIPSSMPPVKLYRAQPDTFVEAGKADNEAHNELERRLCADQRAQLFTRRKLHIPRTRRSGVSAWRDYGNRDC